MAKESPPLKLSSRACGDKAGGKETYAKIECLTNRALSIMN
jgi:hypothetical protein